MIDKEQIETFIWEDVKEAPVMTSDNNLHIYLSNTEEIKSKFKIGNLIIYTPRKYNWFQKKMYKIFFNIDLEKSDIK